MNGEDFSLEDFLEQASITPEDVGRWATRKLEILQQYAEVYGRILSAGKGLQRYYIDGFAGRGIARNRESGELILGSPLVALSVRPPFKKLYFVELDPEKVNDLRKLVGDRSGVTIEPGDANVVLPNKIFPQVQFDRYERALCFLDPYNLRGLKWETVLSAGKSGVIDILLHFPTMDANRTALLHDRSKVMRDAESKMSAFWGSDSWKKAAYTSEGFLPGLDVQPRREASDKVIDAYRERLKSEAAFKIVSKAIPMRNSSGNVIYHIILASPSPAAKEITKWIEKKYGIA